MYKLCILLIDIFQIAVGWNVETSSNEVMLPPCDE